MDEIVWSIEKQDYHVKLEDATRIMDQPKQRISFSGLSKNCCVGIVDAVDSTKITATLTTEKMCEYYRTFLNWMTDIAQEFDAVIVKNVGDSLLYYFPDTEDGKDTSSIRKALECSLTMIESHPILNKLMYKDRLPPVNYRVSVDYGVLTIAKSSNSVAEDLFGPTVNICSKMNTIALPNHIVIGGDLHQLVKSFKDYNFMGIAGYSLGLKLDYPIYSLYRAKK